MVQRPGALHFRLEALIAVEDEQLPATVGDGEILAEGPPAGLGDHVRLPRAQDSAEAAWHLYVIAHHRPEDLRAALAEKDIQARGYYRTPLHRQTAMAPYANGKLELPVTEELARTILALPMSPVLSDEQVHEVVDAVAAANL